MAKAFATLNCIHRLHMQELSTLFTTVKNRDPDEHTMQLGSALVSAISKPSRSSSVNFLSCFFGFSNLFAGRTRDFFGHI